MAFLHNANLQWNCPRLSYANRPLNHVETWSVWWSSTVYYAFENNKNVLKVHFQMVKLVLMGYVCFRRKGKIDYCSISYYNKEMVCFPKNVFSLLDLTHWMWSITPVQKAKNTNCSQFWFLADAMFSSRSFIGLVTIFYHHFLGKTVSNELLDSGYSFIQ